MPYGGQERYFLTKNVLKICVFPGGFRPHTGWAGPLRAHMGTYGPSWAHMGPARALEEREKLKQKKVTYFFLRTRCFLTSRHNFLMENSVLQVSARNTLEIADKITSKTKFSIHFMQIPYHLHPARQGAHLALSNSLVIIVQLVGFQVPVWFQI